MCDYTALNLVIITVICYIYCVNRNCDNGHEKDYIMDKNKIRKFMKDWTGHGEEIRDTDNFWNELLAAIGVEEPTKIIKREKAVVVDGKTKSIDIYLDGKKALVEQKSYGIDLTVKEKQSDGVELTPYQQGKRYANNLPYDERVSKIITCNFDEFRIHDLNQKRPELNPVIIKLSELDKKAHIFDFILKDADAKLHSDEEDVSVKAGKYIKELYDMFLEQYGSDDPETLKSLNILCVRLVFLFYCEDAGVFEKDQFLNFLKASDEMHIGPDLAMLFDVLNTKEEDRKGFLPDIYKAFKYVNGGLFAKEIDMPYITKEIYEKIMHLSDAFDWSDIDPTVFGACFESTLNPATRRSGGMHYTSVENIHKVIDPLFLTDLRDELDEILGEKSPASKKILLDNFQDKIASLKFLDPACGSGNFLTETYLCLRDMENRVIKERMDMDRTQVAGQVMVGAVFNPIKVSIQQFYGIEINDFAVSVAMTALWIAEAQMMLKTMEIVHQNIDFLPLETLTNIHEGNALRMDWEDVIPKYELNYIMGNPPFVGNKLFTDDQKEDMKNIFKGKAGRIDYVSAWYLKACEYIERTDIECAFVSTNTISQGVHLEKLWKPLIDDYGVKINFAHTSFKWDNEANKTAGVTVVIVGFSLFDRKDKMLFSITNSKMVGQISPYLNELPPVIVESISTPLCKAPKMVYGNIPRDGGYYTFTEEEKEQFVKSEPASEELFHPFIGSQEYINNEIRWFLFTEDLTPSEILSMPLVKERIENVRQFRLSSKAKEIQKFAETPTKLAQHTQPIGEKFIIVPIVSSERRHYIPIGYIDDDTITNNSVQIIPNASIYDFGILTSNVHVAWMKLTAGRLEMRFRYSKDMTYNTFPWPTPTEEQKAKIEKTAQDILNVRALYSGSSLADLYDPNNEYLYPELKKAHIANDLAVMEAYGIKKGDPEFKDESACVAMLMKMYQKLTEEE